MNERAELIRADVQQAVRAALAVQRWVDCKPDKASSSKAWKDMFTTPFPHPDPAVILPPL